MRTQNTESLITSHTNSVTIIEADQTERLTNLGQNLTPLEKLIDKVDGQGTYQFRSFLVLAFTWFLTSWLLLGVAFFFDDSMTCYQDKIHPNKSCLQTVCASDPSQWNKIISDHANSITFEFQPYLLCDTTSTILQSMVYAGSLIGFFIIPAIADNRGRRPAMFISWAICTIGVLFLMVANSYVLIGIGYFLAGLGSNPAITLCFSFINEQCLYRSRQRYGVWVQIFLAIGQSTIALLFIPKGDWNWRWVIVILFVFVFLTNFALIYLLETPKFLFKKDKQKTLIVLNKIAIRNNKPTLTIQQINEVEDQAQPRNSSLIDIFKYKSLFMISISTGVAFLGIQTIYYGTSLNLQNAGFNMLINQEIIGGSQVLGYICAQLFFSKTKRKPFSLFGLSTSSAMCLLLALFTSIDNSTGFLILETIILVINRLVLCCFWSIFFIYVAELYPTTVRSLGYGWVSALGMVGSTFAPYIIQAAKKIGINTWIIPGVIGLIGTGFIIFLPQTLGTQMEDEIKELKGRQNQKQNTY